MAQSFYLKHGKYSMNYYSTDNYFIIDHRFKNWHYRCPFMFSAISTRRDSILTSSPRSLPGSTLCRKFQKFERKTMIGRSRKATHNPRGRVKTGWQIWWYILVYASEDSKVYRHSGLCNSGYYSLKNSEFRPSSRNVMNPQREVKFLLNRTEQNIPLLHLRSNTWHMS